MRTLGISAHDHDAAAALLHDGVPVAAVQEERLFRRKNDPAFPLAAIEWCLDSAGIEPGDLDAVVFCEKPMLKFARIMNRAGEGYSTFRRGDIDLLVVGDGLLSRRQRAEAPCQHDVA